MLDGCRQGKRWVNFKQLGDGEATGKGKLIWNFPGLQEELQTFEDCMGKRNPSPVPRLHTGTGAVGGALAGLPMRMSQG